MNAGSNSNVQTTPISDWALERYLLGESPAGEFAAISAQEPIDDGLRDRIAALRLSDAEILEAYPPAWMARRIRAVHAERSVRAQRKRAGRIPLFAVPAAVCAALLILLPIGLRTVGSTGQSAAAPGYGDRVKGVGVTAPAIEVWRKEGDSADKLAPLSTARQGDLVQLRYAVPEFCYGALVSVDGRGVLTVHLPDESDSAAPLEPGRFVALDMSYRLDDAPRFEVFYLLTAPERFDIADAARPLKEAGRPIDKWDEPSKTKITAFALRKL